MIHIADKHSLLSIRGRSSCAKSSTQIWPVDHRKRFPPRSPMLRAQSPRPCRNRTKRCGVCSWKCRGELSYKYWPQLEPIKTDDVSEAKRNRGCIVSRSPKGTVNTCAVNCYKWRVVYGTHVVAPLRIGRIGVGHRRRIGVGFFTRCVYKPARDGVRRTSAELLYNFGHRLHDYRRTSRAQHT